MTRKPGLGKGLDALIPTSDKDSPTETALPESSIALVAIDCISPNPRQPRTRMDSSELSELAASIKQHGVIQPLILTQAAESGQFIIIAGERRWLAANQAGISHIPAIIREANEQQLVELALVENVQRADLGPLEIAEAYRQLSDDFELSHEEISNRVGKSRTAITNTLRLLNLPNTVKDALASGKISAGHARALLALATPESQVAATQIILQRDLTVRQTEDLVRKFGGERVERPPKQPVNAEITALEERLRQELGTKVVLKHRRKGGVITIHYYSEEELNSIIEHILGPQSAH
ncbi:MAG: ParB/RepB/Spo0J family partition protein [Anaerolineales bacterium]